MYHKSRKGSMQLSIEAIIILVIAIVLLGLGIAFIKNFFGKAQDPLGSQIDSLKSCNANSETPLLPTNFNVDSTKVQFDLCVYNNGGLDLKNAKIRILSCMDDGGVDRVYFSPETAKDPTGYSATTAPAGTVYPALKFANLGFNLEKRKSGLIPVTLSTYKASGASPSAFDTTQLGTYICNVVVQNPVITGTAVTGYSNVVGPVQVKFVVS